MANPLLYEIAAKLFEVPVVQIQPASSRENTDGWDSFNHLLLINAIEAEMGVTLTTAEIQNARTIGDLESLIAGRNS
jgi:acyl carrier protein